MRALALLGGRTAAVVAAVLLAGCSAHHDVSPARAAAEVQLAGCHMTVHLFAFDPMRIRALVPARYQLGTYASGNRATLAFWVVACRSIRVGTRPARPGALSLVGAQVRSPLAPQGPAGPAAFDHYLLFAHSDDRELVRALRAGGLPADLVRGIRFTRRRTALAGVPWRRGAYEVTVRGYGYDPPHDHDNSYWHDGRAGTSRLEVRFYHATDRSCAECRDASVSARPGSPIAGLLGASRLTQPYVAIDHNRIAAGDATLYAPQRLGVAPDRAPAFLGVEGMGVAPPGRGVRVTKVLPGEPAADAGLRPGDVILAVDGAPARTAPGLMAVVSGNVPGARVAVAILRDGARRTLWVTLGDRRFAAG
jgi:hypothetical protein